MIVRSMAWEMEFGEEPPRGADANDPGGQQRDEIDWGDFMEQFRTFSMMD
jgi:hypothetical protein